MLDESISPADRKKYLAIKKLEEWNNPFLQLNNGGTISVRTAGGQTEQVSPEGLEEFLCELSTEDWPLGRVVSVQPPSFRWNSPDSEAENNLLKKSWSILRDVTRDLHLEVNVWPTEEHLLPGSH